MVCACLAFLSFPPLSAADGADVLARVDDRTITVDEFTGRFEAGLRQRFYHGRVPEARLDEYRRELLQSMIDRLLLVAEAKRRGIEADPARVEAAVARIGRRYEGSRLWREQGEDLVARLRAGLEIDDLIDRLRERVEADLPEASERELRDYYAAHPERFTTPERLRVSLILLKVDPWAPESAWQAAIDEAEGLRWRIASGADFAELARLHSSDRSAADGGDLGYVHKGMLAAEAERVVDELEIGEVSRPLRLLQGIALFRLEAREPPRLNGFDRARERVADLLRRERREARWRGLLERLRGAASIDVDRAVLAGIGQR